MNVGELRERVTIKTASVTRNAYNEEIITWTSGATVWAKVVERGGREPQIADRPVMIVAYEVTIRAGATITHKDRLTWGSKTLSVETVTPMPKDGLIILRCLEVVA